MKLASKGLAIRTPETAWNVPLTEVPMWASRMGGCADVKVPYSNAGQGVCALTGATDLDAFISMNHQYGRFIVKDGLATQVGILNHEPVGSTKRDGINME